MAGGTNGFTPTRRRGRPGAVARNFLAAVGSVTSSSSTSNNNTINYNQQYDDPQRHEVTPATPKKSPSVHANTTPATEISSSSPAPYSPSIWGSAPTRRSSSTRSQQSAKTEPTLDTLESSLGRESSSTSLRQPQPLQRTPNLRGQQGVASPRPIKKPTTIYEQPHVMATPSRHEQQQHIHGPHNHGHYGQHQRYHYASSSSPRFMESPSTPDAADRIYSPPMFPATTPRHEQHHHHSDHSSLTTPNTTGATFNEIRPTESYLIPSPSRNGGHQHSDHSTLTASTSLATPNTTGATLDEIRPTESYLIPSRTNDFEQRTTTSSITTQSTSQHQQRVASLDAHVQQKTPKQSARQITEDWESVSTNEVSGYGRRVDVQNMPGEHPKSLGQSIDQGIDLLLGSRWVNCSAPMVALPDRAPLSATPSPSQSPSRKNRRVIHQANSSVSGASTEIATNRAVDLALKRVQEIEKSRGTEQALHEARQALVRLKDTQYLRPSPPPPDFTVQMPSTPRRSTPTTTSAASSPSIGRLSFGTPSIPAPKCEAKSILSDSTEEGSGARANNNGSVSSMQMLPVGRLDKKVHRMAQQQQGQYAEDGDHSLPNDSLPSSIGVEVDSKGVTKSNPALRAVFEQHTLESLRRQRGASYKQQQRGASYKQQQREADFVDPALVSFYHPPPPPSNPPLTRRVTHNEVRNYSMKTGQRTIVNRAPSSPPPAVQQQPFREDPHDPDPIVCHGSYVSYEPDGNESSVVPTVVHPAHLMTAPSHDSTLSGDHVFDGLSSPDHGARKSFNAAPTPDRIISPLSTHIPAEPPTEPKTRPVSRFARASRLAKRWPPVSSSRALPGHDQSEQKHAEGDKASDVTRKSVYGNSEPQRSEGEMANNIVQATKRPETVTSNLHSSPAWASKQRMQDVQHQSTGQPSPKPATSGSRISELRKQLFAKKSEKHGSDSYVVRRKSQETLGEPAIDDTSIDLQSVRSAFESIRGSVAEAEEDNSDDDTASVKSLKEKFEGSTGTAQKNESGVSKVRAMFESKNRPLSKPFEGGTSELQEVFSKFQRNVKPAPKPKLERLVSQDRVKSDAPLTEKTETGAPDQEAGACPETPNKETEQSKQGATRVPNAGTVSVAERIRALKEKNRSTPVGRRTVFPPYGNPKSSTAAPRVEKKGKTVVAPIGQVRPRGSPTTISEARKSLRSSPNGALSRAHVQRDESGSMSAIPGPVKPAKLRSSPTSMPDAALHKSAPPHITHANKAEVARLRSSPTTIGEARRFLRPAPVLHSTQKNQTQQNVDQAPKSMSPNHAPETISSPAATQKLGEKVVESSASPMTGARDAPLAKFSEGLTAAESYVSRSPANQANLRSSPTTIEEARKALSASPLSHGTENSLFESDPVDESQIEQEIAAITATDPLNDSSDTSVRKFDWFQRAAVEAGGMSVGEDTSTENRPVTPRVQDRVRMFASANAAISGVRRPVPTPANFNAELREIAKQRPMTPERQRLTFRGWMGEPVSDVGLIRPGGVNEEGVFQVSTVQNTPVDFDMHQPSGGFGGQPMEVDVEKWFKPKPRRFDPATTATSPRGFVRDYGPQQQALRAAPQMLGGNDYRIPMQPMDSHHIEEQYVQNVTQNRQAVANDNSMGKELSHSEDSRNVSAVPAQADVTQNSSSAKQSSVDQDESGSEFSDGVTLDMSIAEVSGLTLPTALISRPGGERSVATVEEEVEQDSENSSKQNAEVEAKRSEASSSQTSEALVPLLNRCLRQRPMSDERSMGDSFFEARAIVANHWSKTSEIGQQRIPAKEAKKTHEVKDDSSGGWDAARIENSFPVTPSNAGDMFEFESGWEAFSADKRTGEDLFKADEEKKSDDLAARSTTPTRSNRARHPGSYLDRRYPEYPPRQAGAFHDSQPPTESPGQLREQSAPLSNIDVLAPATSSSFEASPEDSPQVVALSSFESAERLSRSHLARHAVNKAGSVTVHNSPEISPQGPPQLHNTQRSDWGRPTSFFGRTHPQTADPTWNRESYSPSYDPTLPTRPPQQQEAQVPSWRPPTHANPIGDAMQRYGAQHAALIARLKALKEARVRRANAIYARTTSMFPRQVEIDDYSLSTKSSTQFGGSHFMESLKVD